MNEKILFDFDANPRQREALELVMSGGVDILCYGGAIRGGKTFIALGIAFLLMQMFPGYRVVFIRETELQLKLTTLVSFHKLLPLFAGIKKNGLEYTLPNGSSIIFMAESFNSDKESERFKGLEVNSIFIEEVSGVQKATFDKCKERKGTWNLPYSNIPNFIFCTCNPTFEWPRTVFYTPYKTNQQAKNVRYIQANANDNPFISEDTKRGWKDTMGFYEYNTFVLGDWDCPVQTSGNYLSCFNPETHVKKVSIREDLPIHVTIDQNVNPFVAVGMWQIDQDRKRLVKIGNIACKEKFKIQEVEDSTLRKVLTDNGINKPYNRVEFAGELAGLYLKELGCKDIVIMHGDAATRAKNNHSPRSFFINFTNALSDAGELITVDKGSKSNPPIALSGMFINKILSFELDGWGVEINENCVNTITDYLGSKADKDGHIAKTRVYDPITKQSYEPYGHFVDSDKYFIIDVFKNEFKKYKKGKLK